MQSILWRPVIAAGACLLASQAGAEIQTRARAKDHAQTLVCSYADKDVLRAIHFDVDPIGRSINGVPADGATHDAQGSSMQVDISERTYSVKVAQAPSVGGTVHTFSYTIDRDTGSFIFELDNGFSAQGHCQAKTPFPSAAAGRP